MYIPLLPSLFFHINSSDMKWLGIPYVHLDTFLIAFLHILLIYVMKGQLLAYWFRCIGCFLL